MSGPSSAVAAASRAWEDAKALHSSGTASNLGTREVRPKAGITVGPKADASANGFVDDFDLQPPVPFSSSLSAASEPSDATPSESRGERSSRSAFAAVKPKPVATAHAYEEQPRSRSLSAPRDSLLGALNSPTALTDPNGWSSLRAATRSVSRTISPARKLTDRMAERLAESPTGNLGIHDMMALARVRLTLLRRTALPDPPLKCCSLVPALNPPPFCLHVRPPLCVCLPLCVRLPLCALACARSCSWTRRSSVPRLAGRRSGPETSAA